MLDLGTYLVDTDDNNCGVVGEVTYDQVEQFAKLYAQRRDATVTVYDENGHRLATVSAGSGDVVLES